MGRTWWLVVLASCAAPAGTGFGDDTDTAVVESDAGDSDTTGAQQADDDGDGVLAAEDCDDHDPLIHPFAPERCNGVDDDCDHVVDQSTDPVAGDAWLGPLYQDFDVDGYGRDLTATSFCIDPGTGWVAQAGDCDDNDVAAFPGGTKPCATVTASCGNGAVEPGETCDDGGHTAGDGCSPDCLRERCGDGVVQAGRGETCDDGGFHAGDGCSPDCRLERCGDGVVAVGLGETCDDGNATDGDGCSAACGSERCGDGQIDAELGEACDDGAHVDGDGCSSVCLFEGCGDGAVDGDETCDDGNRTDGDGCSATCTWERFQLHIVSASVSPTELSSGLTWDLFDYDLPADCFLTGVVDGARVLRSSVDYNDNTPVWASVATVAVPVGSTLTLTLADFDSASEPDVIGIWTLDHATLTAKVGQTLHLTGSMVDDLTIEVAAPW